MHAPWHQQDHARTRSRRPFSPDDRSLPARSGRDPYDRQAQGARQGRPDAPRGGGGDRRCVGLDPMSKRVFDFTNAIVRTPAPSVVDGLRVGGEAPSHDGVLAEHRAYVAALEAAGLNVEVLAPLDEFPDSVFVEDPAFVLAEGAILLRPGAPSRIGEA